MSPFYVYRVRRNGSRKLLSEHLHIADAIDKASRLRSVVVADAKGTMVPYDYVVNN